ncbi:helix-turn-helix domain-containing protein [Paraburkholderia sacchari]|uniref:helix-turn-helix domain-containing protein n=1 Tax=Paraburkholderia sacchari TaxID=159450 RepID=UPI003CC82D83
MARVLDYARGEAQMIPTAAKQRCGTSMPIWQAVAFIESAFAQRITLTTLARTAGLSVSRFATLFREQVGMSPHRYLCLVRVRRAQQMLRDGVPPCEVAAEVGFFDQSHLGRHFRRTLGTTPGHYVGRCSKTVGGLDTDQPYDLAQWLATLSPRS